MTAAATTSRGSGATAPGRIAGSDAERRAAVRLADEITAAGVRTAEVETFWCRPNWALTQAWHGAVALAGSLVAVSSPRVGGALLILALLCVLADVLIDRSPGRLLTPERASQNVVCPAPDADPDRTTLVLCAQVDTGRAGVVGRPRLRRISARVREAAGPAAIGWQAALALLIVWLVATAAAREGHHRGTVLQLLQLIPTTALVAAIALLAEQATATPAAGDLAAVDGALDCALAVARSLDAAPAANLDLELALTGATDGPALGLRNYLRTRKPKPTARQTVVVALLPADPERSPAPVYVVSDGALLPLGTPRALREAAARAASTVDPPAAVPVRRRGAGPVMPALLHGLPAIALTADRDLVLALVDTIDATLGAREPATQV